MKDPCNECLVSPICSQLCWKKKNYEILLKNALIHAKQMINKRTNKNNDYVYIDEFLKYKLKYNEHRETFTEIQFRKLKIMKGL